MVLIVVILFLLFLSSVVGGGVVFWKKDELFGTESSEPELEPEPLVDVKLGEYCTKSSECKKPLVCDETSMKCMHAPVDCDGNYGNWSECVYPTGDVCATVGTKTRKFVKTNNGPKNGGAACPADQETDCRGRVIPASCSEIPPSIYYKYVSRDFVSPDDNLPGHSEIRGSLQNHIEKCDALDDCGSFNRWKGESPSLTRSWFKKVKPVGAVPSDTGVVDLYSKTNLHVTDVTPKVVKLNHNTGEIVEESCWPEFNFDTQKYDCTGPKTRTYTARADQRPVDGTATLFGYEGRTPRECEARCTDMAANGNGVSGPNGCTGFLYKDGLCAFFIESEIQTQPETNSTVYDSTYTDDG
jgi:hypothetical protein